MEQLFGIIERITYHNEENGFTVAKLKSPRKANLVTIIGKFAGLQPGESIRCEGTWKVNASHGMQFEVDKYHIEAPADLIGIQKYLESGLIRGIGPKYAKRIVAAFGLQTLEILDESPERLKSIPGIGKKRSETIATCWQAQKLIRKVMLFLSRYEISPSYAQKLYKIYGENCIDVLQENPFVMAKQIHGVGFKKADAIAEKMGIDKKATQRIDSAIDYLLTEFAGLGNTCCPKEELIKKNVELLGIEEELIHERLTSLINEGTLFERKEEEKHRVWSKGLYLCELGIARELKRLLETSSPLRQIAIEKALIWVQEKLKITLAEEQEKGVAKSCQEKIHILTGGPGTGKSTITKAILAITKQLTRKIILAAPTGRAAKRMQEITYFPASTIHSLLSYDFIQKKFRKNRDNPLDCDLIIIDEASMIDTSLMYNLLRAIPSSARVIFVGDIHQLPSVGPGNVLKDLIMSQKIPVTSLTEIFRQARGSQIIVNAHRINQGEFPYLKTFPNSDFFFVKAETSQDVLQTVLDLVAVRLPQKYGFDPIETIQVLSPMKRGTIGIENLNLTLQEKLNPQSDPLFYGGNRFACGDKVMQMRNNYQKEVYNGDIGRILGIDREEQEISVAFDGKRVVYLFYELEELSLAYATSIHKYQGSEAPCVVIPVHTDHFMMLQRNLLYTAVTRGKKRVVIVGTPQAIAIAIANDKADKRETGLQENLITSLSYEKLNEPTSLLEQL